jgi:hypothetical protein
MENKMDDETRMIMESEAYEQALNEIYYNNYECEADADCFAYFAESDPEFIERYNEILNEKIEIYKNLQ